MDEEGTPRTEAGDRPSNPPQAFEVVSDDDRAHSPVNNLDHTANVVIIDQEPQQEASVGVPVGDAHDGDGAEGAGVAENAAFPLPPIHIGVERPVQVGVLRLSQEPSRDLYALGQALVVEGPPPTVLHSAKHGLDVEGGCRLMPPLTPEAAAEVDTNDSEEEWNGDEQRRPPFADIVVPGDRRAGPPEHCFLDYFGCEDDDPFKLTSIFGALSYALTKGFDMAAEIQEKARTKYRIDPQSKKTKLPLKKLFKFITTPGAIIPDREVQLLLIHDAYFKRDERYAAATEGGSNTPRMGGMKIDDWCWSDFTAPLPPLSTTPRGHVQSQDGDDTTVLVALRVHGLGPHPQPAQHTLRESTMDVTASLIAASNTSRANFDASKLSWTPLRFDPSRYSEGFVKWSEEERSASSAAPTPRPTVVEPSPQPAPMGGALIGNAEPPLHRRKRHDPIAHSSFKSSLMNMVGTSNPPAGVSAQSRRRTALAKIVDETDPTGEMAFQGKLYPNLEMGDAGLPLILGGGCHAAFSRSRLRLALSLLLHLLVIGCCSALLQISIHSYSTCCVSAGGSFAINNTLETPQCMMVQQDANTTGDDVLINQCNADMCISSGDVASAVPYGFFWGGWLSLGRLLVLVLLLAALGVVTAVGAAFFSARPVALDNANPRFWKVVYLFHIIECALCVVFAVFVLLTLIKDTHPVENCDILGSDTHLTNLCRAEYSNCDVLLVGYFSTPKAGSVVSGLRYIGYALIVVSGLGFIVSLLPPGPSEELLDSQSPAIPDTAVFRVGPYAPDGISESQIAALQAEIRARWRREKFNAAVAKVKAANKQEAPFNTGSGNARAGLKSLQVTGGQGGTKTSIFRITQLLRLGHGEGKSLIKYRHPDPYLSRGDGKLPPSLEANVNSITAAVLSRLRLQASQHSLGPAAISGATQLPLQVDRYNLQSIDEDSVEIQDDEAPTPFPSRETGIRGVSFPQMMRQLDEQKMEDVLFDVRLRDRIIAEIVSRVEDERMGHLSTRVDNSHYKSGSPPRYDEITAMSPLDDGGGVGERLPIFGDGYLNPPLDPHEIEEGEMGVLHSHLDDDPVDLDDSRNQEALFERRVQIPSSGNETRPTSPDLDETAKPSAAKQRFASVLSRLKSQ